MISDISSTLLNIISVDISNVLKIDEIQQNSNTKYAFMGMLLICQMAFSRFFMELLNVWGHLIGMWTLYFIYHSFTVHAPHLVSFMYHTWFFLLWQSQNQFFYDIYPCIWKKIITLEKVEYFCTVLWSTCYWQFHVKTKS